MTAWPVKPESAQTGHREVQSIPWWVWLIVLAVFTLGWDWLVLHVLIVFLFIAQVGWHRRRIRIDDRYLWAGRSGLHLADITEMRVVKGSEAYGLSAAVKHHVAAPGPSNDKLPYWLRKGVHIVARWPEGLETAWVVGSNDPARLAAAIEEAAAQATRGEEPALLPDPSGVPRPTPALRELLAKHPQREEHSERSAPPWWVWVALAVGYAALYALRLTFGIGPLEMDDHLMYGAILGIALVAVVVSALREVRVRAGVLEAGRLRVPLGKVVSARIAPRPELLQLRQQLASVHLHRNARLPLWCRHALVVRLRQDDPEVAPPVYMYVVGTSKPEQILSFVAREVLPKGSA